ncbi:MAG TPA: hypothetical protein DCY13_20565 [Verrucomicrobiales bacterium]|nr:hypothetical protein [Verrucomicrobiales bacterium]
MVGASLWWAGPAARCGRRLRGALDGVGGATSLQLDKVMTESGRAGEAVVGPGLPPALEKPEQYISDGCVRAADQHDE